MNQGSIVNSQQPRLCLQHTITSIWSTQHIRIIENGNNTNRSGNRRCGGTSWICRSQKAEKEEEKEQKSLINCDFGNTATIRCVGVSGNQTWNGFWGWLSFTTRRNLKGGLARWFATWLWTFVTCLLCNFTLLTLIFPRVRFLRLSERITLDTLRPLPLFLGIQESGHSFCLSAGAFTTIPPADDQKSVWDQLHTRLALNVALFLTNYALVAGGVAIVIALLHPGMLLVLAAVSALWWCHDYLIHQTVTVGSHNIGTLLSINQRSTALTILTVVAIVWKCLIPVVSFLVVSGILIGLHAISRDPQHIEQYSQQLANGNNGTSTVTHGGQALVDRGDIIWSCKLLYSMIGAVRQMSSTYLPSIVRHRWVFKN